MNNEIKFTFDKLCFHEEDAWFIDINFGLLCKLDIESGKVGLIKKIPLTSGLIMQYRRMVSYKDLLVLIPYNSQYLLLYSVIEDRFESIRIENAAMDNPGQMMFSDAYVYKNNVFLIPARYPSIVKMNVDTRELCYFHDWGKEETYNKNRNLFSGNVLGKDNVLYVPYWQSYKVLKIDMDKSEFETIHPGPKGNGICAICHGKDSIILGAKDRLQIIKISLDGYKCEKVKDIVTSGINFAGAAYISKCEKDYLIYPLNGNQIVKVNEEDDAVSVIHQWELEIIDDCKKYAFANLVFLGFEEHNNIIYSYSQYEGKLLAVNKVSGSVNSLVLTADNKSVERAVEDQKKSMMSHKAVMEENQLIGLRDFICYVSGT